MSKLSSIFAVFIFFNLLNYASLALDEGAKKENAEAIYQHLKLRRVYPIAFAPDIHPITPLEVLKSYTPSKKFKLTDKQKYKLSYFIRSVASLVAHLTTIENKVFFQSEIKDLTTCLDLAASFCTAWNYPTKDNTFNELFLYTRMSLIKSKRHKFVGNGDFFKEVIKYLKPFRLYPTTQIDKVPSDVLEINLLYMGLYLPPPAKPKLLSTESLAKALIASSRAEIAVKYLNAIKFDCIYAGFPISKEFNDILEAAEQLVNSLEDSADDDCCSCIN